MALCRCEDHIPEKKYGYIDKKEPIGFPNSSSICGKSETYKRPNCLKTGIIWLTGEEMKDYEKGVRVFSYATNGTKVKVK